MLKKQTVWLLTMLSLMIVLSVYYMTSPGNDDDLAYIDQGEEKAEETASSETANNQSNNETDEDEADVGEISNIEEDELFTTIRMEIQDERSETKEQLDDIVASSSASPEEKNEARNEMNKLNDISKKESILEDSILAAADYEDVLVRHEEETVHVHVKETEELSNTEVVNIMQMVRDEFGDKTVDVVYQPIDEKE